MRLIPFILLFVLFSSCQDRVQTIVKMEEIKSMGNENPALAMQMLDSIRPDIHDCSEYVQMKFRLLEIRLNDKADIIPNSDSAIVSLIPYFESNGTEQDKQEVYYYAGSVYRDLHDTPRALENLLHSLRLCENGICDSVMLRNTYSNLHWLYYNVQDYDNALLMALKETELNNVMNTPRVNALIHAGSSFMHLDSTYRANQYYEQAFFLMTEHCGIIDVADLMVLLNGFSCLSNHRMAHRCHDMIMECEDIANGDGGMDCNMALGRYHLSEDNLDSAAYYYDRIIRQKPELAYIYDASRHLCLISQQQHDLAATSKYAAIFIDASDSLNLGERQKQAATINNEFQYYRNQEAEKRIKAESERRRMLLLIISFSSVLAIVSLTAIYNYRQKHQLKIILAKTEELTNLKKHIACKDDELDAARIMLANREEKIHEAKVMLEKKEAEAAAINGQLERFAEDLKIKEAMIMERTQQNRMLIRILNQSEMEESAEEVIDSIRRSAVGRHHMTSQDWKKLYHAVDSLFPTFKDTMIEKLGSINEKQFQLCYLLFIGLTNPEIQNLTNMPSSTVWRWAKKYTTSLDLPLLRQAMNTCHVGDVL